MKLTKIALTFFSIAALISSVAPFAEAQELVSDGGFESGSFSPAWTNVDESNFSGVGSDSIFANSGSHYAFLGASPDAGSLSQVLGTTPGESYTLSFSLANDSGVPPNFFQILFDGSAVFTLTDATAFDYTVFSFPGLQATTSATTLEFRYMHVDDFFRLDDISVAVPEPGALMLAGPALVGFGLLRRLRRKVTKTPGSAA